MLRLDNVTITLPQISQGEWANYTYYIICEDEFPCLSNDDFVIIPDMSPSNVWLSCLKVERCETNSLKIIEEDGIPVVIPFHDVENGWGVPIFTRKVPKWQSTWEYPENFFWTYHQAEVMLNYIKQKCGVIHNFDRNSYNLISPVGHFNNINKYFPNKK